LEALDSTAAALRIFLMRNAGIVYRHASEIQPIGNEESLYVITGCIRSDGWSLEAFRGAKSGERLRLLKRHEEDESTDAGKIYDWIELGPAEARCWPGTAEQTGVQENNQTLFIQGFKLGVSASFRARMDGLMIGLNRGESFSGNKRNDRPNGPPDGPSSRHRSGPVNGDTIAGSSSSPQALGAPHRPTRYKSMLSPMRYFICSLYVYGRSHSVFFRSTQSRRSSTLVI
jgi:hypothetical protein